MTLSLELFEELLASLKSDPVKNNRRNEARVGVRVRAEIQLVTNNQVGETRQVWVQNVSRSGIGITLRAKAASQQRFLLQLPSHSKATRWALFEVVHVRPAAEGQYGIGARLVRILDDLDQFAPIEPRRAATRTEKEDIARIRSAVLE